MKFHFTFLGVITACPLALMMNVAPRPPSSLPHTNTHQSEEASTLIWGSRQLVDFHHLMLSTSPCLLSCCLSNCQSTHPPTHEHAKTDAHRHTYPNINISPGDTFPQVVLFILHHDFGCHCPWEFPDWPCTMLPWGELHHSVRVCTYLVLFSV